jgi:hypothetical protein
LDEPGFFDGEIRKKTDGADFPVETGGEEDVSAKDVKDETAPRISECRRKHRFMYQGDY